MSKNIKTRIERLEYIICHKHVGKELALDWYNAILNHNKVVLWVFSTEGSRPTRLPSSLRSSMDSNINVEMKLWREERKETWPAIFQRGPYRFAPNQKKLAVSNGLSIPSEDQTLRLFGKLVASAPIAGFEWANYFIDRINSLSVELASDDCSDLYRIVLTFHAIETRAQYWRNKIGYYDLEELQLPEWARIAVETLPSNR